MPGVGFPVTSSAQSRDQRSTGPRVTDRPALRAYPGRFYTVYTDLDPLIAREAQLRMTAMAWEYHQRTRGFSGAIRKALPFYLFKNPTDYHAAGGMPGSGGMFDGQRLLVLAGDAPDSGTWHTVQHEGFHQFAHAVIGADLPAWLNEGLAEYFGESLFTGDGFVSGVAPPWRVQRIRRTLRDGAMRPTRQLLGVSYAQWNNELSQVNYDQAWALVHFLVHADDARYQSRLSTAIRDMARGMGSEQAWEKSFGESIEQMDQRFRQWWSAQPPDPTPDRYLRALTATFTSYLARAHATGQRFESFDDFRTAAAESRLNIRETDWLPPELLRQSTELSLTRGQWQLTPGTTRDKLPSLISQLPDGTRFVGTFTLRGNKIGEIDVTEHSNRKR